MEVFNEGLNFKNYLRVYVKLKLCKWNCEKSFYFFLCVCLLSYKHVCGLNICLVQAEGSSDVLKLELQTIVNCCGCLGNWTLVFKKISTLTNKPFLQHQVKNVIKTCILFNIQKFIIMPGKVVYPFNPSTQKAEARSLSWRTLSPPTYWVPEQPRLHKPCLKTKHKKS